MKVTIPFDLLETNQSVFHMATLARIAGAKAVTNGDYTTFDLNQEKVSLLQVKYLLSVGAEIKGYKFVLKVNPLEDVPEGIPGRETIDDEGAPVVMSWEQWCRAGSPNTYPEQVGVNWYIVPSAVGPYEINDFVSLINDMVSVAAYKAERKEIHEDVI